MGHVLHFQVDLVSGERVIELGLVEARHVDVVLREDTRHQVVKALEDAGIVFLDSERGEGVMLVRGAAEKSRK